MIGLAHEEPGHQRLLYALNADCVEHSRARALVDAALEDRDRRIIADQVYFELYRLLRNPAVPSVPLSAVEAARTIGWHRTRSGWSHCAYEPGMMGRISSVWAADSLAGRNTFDLVLAITLAENGVREFYTRNTDDFRPLGLFAVTNPVDE